MFQLTSIEILLLMAGGAGAWIIISIVGRALMDIRRQSYLNRFVFDLRESHPFKELSECVRRVSDNGINHRTDFYKLADEFQSLKSDYYKRFPSPMPLLTNAECGNKPAHSIDIGVNVDDSQINQLIQKGEKLAKIAEQLDKFSRRENGQKKNGVRRKH